MEITSTVAIVLFAFVPALVAAAGDSTPPTAVIDAPVRIERGAELTLSGARSTDPGGTVVRYDWTRISGTGGAIPVGETFRTSGPVFPVLQSVSNPLAVGLHRFQLRVVDGSGNVSQPTVVQVAVIDGTAPTAVISAPPRIQHGQPLVLLGSASSDVQGSIVSYSWTRRSGAGGEMLLGQPFVTAVSSFTVPQGESSLAVGRHVFELRVADNSGNVSQPAASQVTVVDATPPTAVLTGPSTINEGTTLVLNGSRSADLAGRITRYQWSRVGGETLVTTTPRVTIREQLAPGAHTFQLVVTDDSGNASQPSQIRVTVRAVDRQLPVAVLSAPQSVASGAVVTLSAAGSKDAAGQIAIYEWTHVSGSGGSLAAGKTTQTKVPELRITQPTKSPMVPGTHRFRLVVVDRSGNRSKAVERTVSVAKPVPIKTKR